MTIQEQIALHERAIRHLKAIEKFGRRKDEIFRNVRESSQDEINWREKQLKRLATLQRCIARMRQGYETTLTKIRQ